MSINQNARLDASQVEDLRSNAAKLSGLADLPPEDNEDDQENNGEEEPAEDAK